MASAFAQAVLDFIVGEHSAQDWTPIDFAVCEVGDAKAHEHFFALFVAHALPVGGREGAVKVGPKMWEGQAFPPLVIARGVDVEVPIFGKGRGQLGNGTGFLGLGVVPAFKKLSKNPLCPSVVGRIACAHLARPIVAKPQLLQLFSVAVDVLFRGDGGMLPCLDGILLRRQTKTVVPHGVQDVEPFVALVARKDIRRDVSERVSDMKTRA